jgi:PAS domain S-box-containing protein
MTELSVADRSASRRVRGDALRERERLLRLMIDSVNYRCIYLLDPEGCIRTWHAGAERITGYSEAEIIGRDFSIFHTADDVAAGEPAHALAMASATGRYLREAIRVRRDGSRYWANVTIQPVWDEAGEPIGFAELVSDTTLRFEEAEALTAERDRAAEALRQTSDTLQAIITASPLAIFTTDAANRVTSWNPAAERIYGYTAEEMMVPDPWPIWNSMTVPNSDSPVAIEAMVMLAGMIRDVEVQRRRRDGTVVDLSISAAVLHERSGRVSGYVYIVDDISHRRIAEHRLRQAQRMEAVGQLTGGIAHDFNNLLAIIQGNLELISERVPVDQGLPEMSQAALAATERGAILTHRLLAFSRRQQLAPIVVDVERLIADSIVVLSRSIEESIRIECAIDPGLWKIRIDPSQLENVLLNLATNARDAMPDGGTLTIGAENAIFEEQETPLEGTVAPGAYVRLTVGDTGTGMSAEVMARAMEPFFTTKPVGRGTGLGLSMVYGFVKQSGGHIDLRSTPGAGTLVTLYLPEAGTGIRAGEPAGGEPIGARERVALVVEDDPDVRYLQSRALKELGFRTLEAEDGPAGLALLEGQADIDLLLADVVLPQGISGPALARLAQGRRPGLKVIFMSGYAPDTVARLGQEGGIPILAKPFSRQELAVAVEQQFAGDGQ